MAKAISHRRRPRGRKSAAGRPVVVIASRIYLPEPAAASLRLGALADALVARDAEVVVLTATPAGQHRSRSTPRKGVVVRSFPVVRDAQGYVRGYIPYLTFDIPLALRLLLMRRPDVVVCEPPPTTGIVVRAICALRGIPYTYYAADIWSDASAATSAPGLVVRAVTAMERLTIQGASRVLSVGDTYTARIQRWRQHGIETVGHGVDTSMYAPDGPAHEMPGPYFLYAGTASEVHGATIFVEALRLVLEERPDARLVFIGQGTDYPALAAAADSLPEGALTVLPRIPAEEVAPWFRGAVASLASVRPDAGYEYSVPTKSYASLACGCPVILAGPGPLADYVATNRLGWAEPYDAAAISRAMLEALRTDRGDRLALAAWAEANVSANKASGRGAEAVLDAIRSDRG